MALRDDILDAARLELGAGFEAATIAQLQVESFKRWVRPIAIRVGRQGIDLSVSEQAQIDKDAAAVAAHAARKQAERTSDEQVDTLLGSL